jgi:rubrerythrin
MLEKPAQLLKVLKDAIKAESDGYHFYQMAAEKTEDSKGKEVFHSLAQDELDHGSVLKGLYQAIKEKSDFRFDRKRRPKKKSSIGSKSPIFSVGFKRKIKENHFALSALRIAQMLERDAIEFYSRNAKRSKHPELKSLFNFLVEWETDHLKILIAQENFLQGKFEI